jgi:predicted GNAT family N-acyltransferase
LRKFFTKHFLSQIEHLIFSWHTACISIVPSKSGDTVQQRTQPADRFIFNGVQLLAAQPVRKGELLYDFSTAPIASDITYQTVALGDGQHVLDLPFLAKLSHSCDPSVIVDTSDKKCYAAKDLVEGDCLTFFYPSTEWKITQPFSCDCGSNLCLGIITGAESISRQQLDRHFINAPIKALKTLQTATPKTSYLDIEGKRFKYVIASGRDFSMYSRHVNQLRLAVWKEEGAQIYAAGESEALLDYFDFAPTTFHFMYFIDEELVASARLVYFTNAEDSNEQDVIPIETLRNLPLPCAGFTRLVIKSAYRSLGLADRLVRARIFKAYEIGAKSVCLTVVKSKRTTYYQKLGFILSGTKNDTTAETYKILHPCFGFVGDIPAIKNQSERRKNPRSA